MEDGDIVNVDISVYYKGYHGDLNETFVVGTVDDESKKLVKAAHDVSFCPTASFSLYSRVTLRKRLQSFADVLRCNMLWEWVMRM